MRPGGFKSAAVDSTFTRTRKPRKTRPFDCCRPLEWKVSLRLPATTITLIPATSLCVGAPISHSHAETMLMSSAGHVTLSLNKIGGMRKRRQGSSSVTITYIVLYRVSGVSVSAGHTSERRPAAHWWAGRIDKDGMTS